MSKRVLLLVDWLDSCSLSANHTWKPESEVLAVTPVECRSVGWLVRETKAAITLVSSTHGDRVSGDITIPRFAITKRRALKA